MKKKSIKKSATAFGAEVDRIKRHLSTVSKLGLSDEAITWAHDYAVIRLYRTFEDFVLSSLVASINNDTAQLSLSTGVSFPKHLTNEVCEYIIVKGGYFDFRGRDGLIKTLKRHLPEAHFIVIEVKKTAYKSALEQLSSLRNFAAHNSPSSKRAAMKAIGANRLSASGVWLKETKPIRQNCKYVTRIDK